MGEADTYGLVCSGMICMDIPRRFFVFVFAMTMTVLCYIHIVWWVTTWLSTVTWEPENVTGCVGVKCYEVFSCFGMKDATHNIREPLVTLTSALFFPLGAAGALWENQRWVRWLGVYLAASALLHIGLILLDSIYIGTCQGYSKDFLDLVLTNRARIPPSLLRMNDRKTIQDLNSYSFKEVDQLYIGNNIQIFSEYYVFTTIWAFFLLWASQEARCLAMNMHRGHIGLGVNYGLDFFDELAKRDAKRESEARKKKAEMLTRSRFVQDANSGIPRVDPAHDTYGATMDANTGVLEAGQQEETRRVVG